MVVPSLRPISWRVEHGRRIADAFSVAGLQSPVTTSGAGSKADMPVTTPGAGSGLLTLTRLRHEDTRGSPADRRCVTTFSCLFVCGVRVCCACL